jgi:hypothetical protein
LLTLPKDLPSQAWGCRMITGFQTFLSTGSQGSLSSCLGGNAAREHCADCQLFLAATTWQQKSMCLNDSVRSMCVLHTRFMRSLGPAHQPPPIAQHLACRKSNHVQSGIGPCLRLANLCTDHMRPASWPRGLLYKGRLYCVLLQTGSGTCNVERLSIAPYGEVSDAH